MIEISWQALGSALLFLAALIYVALLIAHKVGKRDGVGEYLDEKRILRSQRRREIRLAAGQKARQQLDPFPGDDDGDEWLEKLATTGELRLYAETGEIDRLRGEIAQFFRTWSLREWTRKREDEVTQSPWERVP